MGQGDIDVQVVESPITDAKITTAAELAITNTSGSAQLSVTGFNQGRSVLIVAVEGA